MKTIQQKDVAICIVLSIVTCGIYGLYWLYTLNEDLNALAPEKAGAPGSNVILFTIITCGLYGIYWLYTQGDKIDYLKRQQGLVSNYTGIVYIVLSFIGLQIIAYALMQNEINNLI